MTGKMTHFDNRWKKDSPVESTIFRFVVKINNERLWVLLLYSVRTLI